MTVKSIKLTEVVGSKISAMVEEFPFIAHYFKPSRLREVKVEIVDLLLLKHTGETSIKGLFKLTRSYPGPILILDGEGVLIKQVAEFNQLTTYQRVSIFLNTISDADWRFYETVAHAIDSLEDSDKDRIRYIVQGWGCWSECYDGSITIHKVPKKFTLIEWIDKLTNVKSAY